MQKKSSDSKLKIIFLNIFFIILQYSEAIQLCLKKNVLITDELDNLLTPNKLGIVSGQWD